MAQLILPPKNIVGNIDPSSVSVNASYTNASSVWDGFPITFNATLTISPQLNSSEDTTPIAYQWNGDDIEVIYKNISYIDIIENFIDVTWNINLEDHNNDSITGYQINISSLNGSFEFIDLDKEQVKIDISNYKSVLDSNIDIDFPFCPKSIIINCDLGIVEVSFEFR